MSGSSSTGSCCSVSSTSSTSAEARMATIIAIDDRTVHQIQSGQVIVDLCSVVKELVENSLDAGATSIEIRFRNQGLESIEVQDNGAGISPDNYKSVALKHHTSKLTTYGDLSTLETFGFRGEALSSLCNLSTFTVTTCMAKDAPKGTKLEFEQSGQLLTTSVVAAQKGTTVSVENLFHNLPVRRRELERNIKREWTRVINVLAQYACIQTGVKLSISQVNMKGKKTSLFATKGNATTKDNIVNVFGAKTLTALVKLDLSLELERSTGIGQWSGSDREGETRQIKISGHISRPAYGEGRQTPDRQMFFVNSRPCGLPQVAKAFNEVYKMYNSHQSPFIFANIHMDTHLYDVNVSPDKRTILLHDQGRMLEHLKTALIELFDTQDYTLPISQAAGPKQTAYKQLTLATSRSTLQTMSSIDTSRSSSTEESEHDNELKRSASGITSNGSPEDSEEDGEDAYIPKRSKAVPQVGNRDERAAELIQRLRSREAPMHENASDEEQAGPHTASENHNLDMEKEEQPATSKPTSLGCVDQSAARQSRVSSFSPDLTYQAPVPVRDFSARLAELALPRSSKSSDVYHNAGEEADAAMSSSPGRPSQSELTNLPAVSGHDQRISRSPTGSIGNENLVRPFRPRPTELSTVKKATTEPSATSLPSFGGSLGERFGASAIVSDGGLDNAEDRVEQCDEKFSAAAADFQSSGSVGEDAGMFVDDQSQTRRFDAQPSLENVDSDFLDDVEKKALEDAKVQEMIKSAEQDAIRPLNENAKRTQNLLKGRAKTNSTSTVSLEKIVSAELKDIKDQMLRLFEVTTNPEGHATGQLEADGAFDSKLAEEKLSLTITKTDFAKMNIIGQFNLGFILATRTNDTANDTDAVGDDLFIIDQHASDEKYNFERLQATTVVQSQRLVQPKILDLTAVEEEIVMENLSALGQNGFIVAIDDSGDEPIGRRCSLLSLPLSRETAFSLRDLEELISLLAEHPSGALPRPSRVRKMFAMRACRSSIMIGKTLTSKQMQNVVRHMGEIDKPWNCPHGRPTMRHLCALDAWDKAGWREGKGMDGDKAQPTAWAAYAQPNRGRS